MKQVGGSNWKDRLQAFGVHLGLSVLVAALAALLVFGLWYPHPYREISGGTHLFWIVVTVDVILGPLITLAVFNRGKTRVVLLRDLGTVAAIQVAALIYGLWVVSAARPVHLVYEFDRFSVVHAIDVPPELVGLAPSDVQPLPLTGPTMLAVRPFKSEQEKFEATMMALQGLSLGARADLWQPYAEARERVLAAARPVAELRQRFSQQVDRVTAAVSQTGAAEAELRWLPLAARTAFWTVLIDARTAEVRGFVPLDSF
jgi:hypothetical protein